MSGNDKDKKKENRFGFKSTKKYLKGKLNTIAGVETPKSPEHQSNQTSERPSNSNSNSNSNPTPNRQGQNEEQILKKVFHLQYPSTCNG